MLSRRGATLAELVVAITMFGIIGAAASGAVTQQERIRSRIARRLAAEAQLREAVAPVVADLGAASPAGGDFDATPPRDTMLELRATIGEGYACGVDSVASRSIVVLPLGSARSRTPAAGDVAWAYRHPGWWSASVDAVAEPGEAVAGCHAGDIGGRALRVELGAALPVGAGMPLRFTRRIRYSLYTAGDGQTYLGLREWSVASGAFAGVQPIAGPFEPGRSRFRYHDSDGSELASGSAAGRGLATVTLHLVGARIRGAPPRDGSDLPEVVVRVALRNRQ